jgi:glycine cleavage system protein P-like pyridoxal-binding family
MILKLATEVAILSANYIAKRLIDYGFHPPMYLGQSPER